MTDEDAKLIAKSFVDRAHLEIQVGRGIVEGAMAFVDKIAESGEPLPVRRVRLENELSRLTLMLDDETFKHDYLEACSLIRLALARLEAEPAAAREGPPPFVQELLDADSVFTRPDGLWQLKPKVKMIDVFRAVAAAVSNPGPYVEDHFVRADGKRFRKADVLDRLNKAK